MGNTQLDDSKKVLFKSFQKNEAETVLRNWFEKIWEYFTFDRLWGSEDVFALFGFFFKY